MSLFSGSRTQQRHFGELAVEAGASFALGQSPRQRALVTQHARTFEEADVALSHLTHAHRVDDRVTECIHEQQVVHVAVNLTEHVHPPLDHLRVDLHLGTDHNGVTG